MLDEDELQALADDIRDLGQLQPIVLDSSGRILDGRNRLRACELAEVEPEYITYSGTNPSAYTLSVNLRRRSLSKGQAAMIAAKACSVAEHDPRSETERSARSVSEQAGVSLGRIGQANTVLRYTPNSSTP